MAPKILPIRPLMNDPLPDCVGGGGTTVLDESGMLPLAKRCRSCETSAEGGGAITEGAGMFSLEFRALARSGAETGGGSMVAFICTGELESSRLTPPGAGGITFAASAGVERARSRVMFGAGATTYSKRCARTISSCSTPRRKRCGRPRNSCRSGCARERC